jgi:parvulin-like peptidyl-prolyl isomerase
MLIKGVHRIPVFKLLFLLLVSLTSCSMPGLSPAQTPTPTSAPTAVPATATSQPPTPTPPALAMRVNGEGIWLEDYQAELKRLEKAQTDTGKTLSAEQAAKMVQDSLSGDLVLAQNAVKDGYKLDESGLQTRLDKITEEMGGVDKLAAWMQANNYSEASLKRSLQRSLAADWERNKIIAAVPQVTEQAHARQILVKDETQANSIYQRLQNGTKFDDLALKYDPETEGDLGWFPRGILFQPDVETAVFKLQPGQYSELIKTNYGFQIVELIELDPQHAVSPEVRLTLQHKLLDAWMKDQLAHAKIEILAH